MEDTFTTIVTPTKDGIEIMTQHDQTGSASVNGFVPTENIPSLIEELKKFIGFNLPVSGSGCDHPRNLRGQDQLGIFCQKCGEYM